MSEERADIIYGRWPVKEALEAGPVNQIFIAKGVGGGPIDEIIALAKRKKVPFHWMDRKRMDQMAGPANQGVVAHVMPMSAESLDVVLGEAQASTSRGARLLFLDGIQDPGNLGAILRSAVFFGVAGVVIPKWRAASITAAVVRASAGAARLIPVAEVANLATAIQAAKKEGFWIVGADMEGQDAKKADLPRPFALVMGSEGEGLHELIRKKCDVMVSITGHADRPGVASLNVGVATGILLQQFC